MKNHAIIILIYISTSIIYSQSEIPADTLLQNQEKMLENQQIILEEVVYIDPLLGKRYGIEFNPASLLMSTSNENNIVISGGFSLFPTSKSAEIAFPIYFAQGENDLMIFHIDSHYRNFTGKNRNGFYISTGLRYTMLKGRKGFDFFGYSYGESSEIITTSKIGLTFGIGYRIFGKNGLYWGTSLFAGRYFTDNETSISGAGTADNIQIIDMELLKIGKVF